MTEEVRQRIIPLIRSTTVSFPLEEHYEAVVLSDYMYWGPIQEDLDEWCEENDCFRTGTVLFFKTNEAFIMFKLRWL